MKTKLLAGLIGAGMLTGTALAEDSGITFVPDIGLQYKNLSFDQNINIPDSANASGDFSEGLFSVTGAVTLVYDKFFAKLKADQTLGSSETESTAPYAVDDAEIERSDFTFTLGYNVWDSVNVFAGYISGETTIDPKGGGNATFPSVDVSLADLEPNYEQTYEESGFFLGASYGWGVGNAGFMSASLAYAFMDGEYSDNFSDPFKFEGDSDGFSLGFTWTYPVNDKFRCYADLRYQKYDMSADEDNSGNFAGWKVETEETITALTIGVQYVL